MRGKKTFFTLILPFMMINISTSNEMHLKGRGTFDFNSVAYKGPRPPLLPQNK
jgi:hypothetical protein